jgi:hypothetical protein
MRALRAARRLMPELPSLLKIAVWKPQTYHGPRWELIRHIAIDAIEGDGVFKPIDLDCSDEDLWNCAK